MNKIDFSQCRFISENMWFITYTDFCDNRRGIRRLFNELDKNGKEFYMWYVYANIHMKECHKNAIWDYLNDYDPNAIELLRLARFYKSR